MSDQGISPELGIEQKAFQPHAAWRDKFNGLLQKGIIDEVKVGTVNNNIWQQVRYGEGTKGKDDQEIYRGYIMVEPQRIPLALGILSTVAEQRKNQGKSTEFKWLLKTEDPDWINKAANGQWQPKEIGEYPYLKPDDPRIAIYANSMQDIQEILRTLVQEPQWLRIEEERIQKYGGHPPRRPGTNSFIDEAGREWRSLNFNDKPGLSESEAQNPQWRSLKTGTPTGNL